MPKVSVVITTRNRPKLLERALHSVLHQTYENCEIHVVDDASSDNTLPVVENLFAGQEEPRHWRHEERRGLAAARNTGVAMASGDYIAFLDDDDEWKPECVEKRVALLQKLKPEERQSLGVVYAGCEIHIPHESRITYNMPRIEGSIRECIRSNGLSTIPSSCLFPKRVLESIGGFDENLRSSVDHDIWMNLAVHGYHAIFVNEPLVIVYHFKRKRSIVSDTGSRIRGVEQYLAKWTSTYENWYGKDGARRYTQRYRTKVLGDLAGRKLAEGEFRGASHLFCHVTRRNKWSFSSSGLLMWLIGRNIVRMFIPGKLIEMVNKSVMP